MQPLVWPTLALLLESAAGAMHVDQDGAGSICGTVHGQYQAKTLHGKGCKPCCCARCEEGEADRTANYSTKCSPSNVAITGGDRRSITPALTATLNLRQLTNASKAPTWTQMQLQMSSRSSSARQRAASPQLGARRVR